MIDAWCEGEVRVLFHTIGISDVWTKIVLYVWNIYVRLSDMK